MRKATGCGIFNSLKTCLVYCLSRGVPRGRGQPWCYSSHELTDQTTYFPCLTLTATYKKGRKMVDLRKLRKPDCSISGKQTRTVGIHLAVPSGEWKNWWHCFLGWSTILHFWLHSYPSKGALKKLTLARKNYFLESRVTVLSPTRHNLLFQHMVTMRSSVRIHHIHSKLSTEPEVEEN